MAHIINDLKQGFKRGNIVIQLIYINVGVFVVTSLLSVFFLLFKRTIASIFQWFELPASVPRFIEQPWSLITYMFMHADFLHILFNMLWLYWFGYIFLRFFSSKHLRGLYIVGGIFGGLLYMLSYNIFPLFESDVQISMLLGASASILAIVVATAYREPNYPIRLLFLGTIQLKYLALFVVVIDVIFMASDNAGGHIAHLGGALTGLWFAAALKRGTDITAWVNKIIDGFLALFEAKTWRRKPKMKVHRGRSQTLREKDYDYNSRRKMQSDEIDRILDKLKKSGYESLTTEEKKSLFDASKH